MNPTTIDRYLDECGITPGKWYVDVCNSGESCWCRTVGTDAKDEDGEELYIIPAGSCGKDDAHIIAASWEMLKALIEEALWYEKTGQRYNHIDVIEKALSNKSWLEIKKRLEELDAV